MGPLDVDRFITAMLSHIGREALLADGADPSAFHVSDEAVDEGIKAQLQAQQKMGKGEEIDMDSYREKIDAAFGWERFREKMRAIKAFEKVFLPQVPEGGSRMPEITWNALSGRERDLTMRDNLSKMYEEGSPLPEILRMNFVRMVKDALLHSLDVEYFYRGNLKPGVLVRINDRELLVEDVYAVIKDRITDDDRMTALREILLLKAMDRALMERGSLLDPKAADEAFSAHEEEFAGTIFPLPAMITLYGYLNMACYRNIHERKAGFQKMIRKEITDAALKEFYEGAARLLYENGSVKVQTIFFGIHDHKEGKLRENGYAWAEMKMEEAVKRLKAGESFEALAAEYVDKEGTFNTHDFRFLNRSYLRRTLGDTQKSALISGFSLSDYLFYRARTGEIVGPVVNRWGTAGNPSHKGIYLVKAVEFRRSQTLKPFEISKPMVKNDYLELRFAHWAQEALKGSMIELTLKR
jgi:hypothetical protein